jgi:hypothetical protein
MCRIVLVCQDLDLWKLAASDQCTETLRSPRMGDFIDAKAPNADRLFGYKLTGQYFPFIVCASGIFGCYCLSSIAQEYIYYRGFQSSTLLTLSAKAFAALWGIGAGGLRNRKAPQIAHVGVGILTFATMFLSNRALVTLNYPTQTLSGIAGRNTEESRVRGCSFAEARIALVLSLADSNPRSSSQ